tara:strand:+ start:10854 stop:11264 length:411 start_codon:yes stop_codon:yes gene_type:complete
MNDVEYPDLIKKKVGYYWEKKYFRKFVILETIDYLEKFGFTRKKIMEIEIQHRNDLILKFAMATYGKLINNKILPPYFIGKNPFIKWIDQMISGNSKLQHKDLKSISTYYKWYDLSPKRNYNQTCPDMTYIFNLYS